MKQPSDHFRHSSLREGLLEHLFVGEVMRRLWLRGVRDIEVLRPVTDVAGYDVVLTANGVIRHVQLKSSAHAAKTARQKINTALTRHPSSCIVWMRFDPDTMALGPFLWFGGPPGQPLPDLGDRMARHTKGDATGAKAVRPAIRILAKGQFGDAINLEEIVDKLFGPAKS